MISEWLAKDKTFINNKYHLPLTAIKRYWCISTGPVVKLLAVENRMKSTWTTRISPLFLAKIAGTLTLGVFIYKMPAAE
ncbi:hypothetical protein DSUL_60004 [Desulfovibrionales bacterium]